MRLWFGICKNLFSHDAAQIKMVYSMQDRRKSRDDQKRDLALLENREDLWRNQLEDKNNEIAELNKRIGVSTVLLTF